MRGREASRVGVEEAHELALERATARATSHRPCRAPAPKWGSSSASCYTVAPARPRQRGGAVVRGGVDHDDLVDRPGLAQRTERADDLPDGGGALARGQAHRDALRRARRRCAMRGRRNGGRCAFPPSRSAAVERHRLYYRKPWPSTAQTEPWSALLDEGREDGRLVREAREGPAPRSSWSRRPSFTRMCSRRWSGWASSSSTPTRPRPFTPRGRARRSSRPARPRASRCASTCPRSTCSADSARASAVSVPDEGARAGSGARACVLRPQQAGAPGDLRRRHAARGARADPQPARTSCSPTRTCCTSASFPTTAPGTTVRATSPSS